MMRITVATVSVLLCAMAASAQDVAHGKQVFADSKCGVCHSIDGQGNKKGPLDSVGAKLSPEDIRQWIVAAPEMAAKAKADRKPPMKAYTDLSKQDVDDLVAYLSTLKKK